MGLPDLANHGHVDHHSEWRNTAGPACERAQVSLRVIPIRKRVVPAHGDVDGSLFEELFDRHSASSRNGRTNAATTICLALRKN